MKDLDRNQYKLTRECLECGHKQEVTPAVVCQDDQGIHKFFGSAYDFCDECDGPMKTSQ
jgi:hypothetical protein